MFLFSGMGTAVLPHAQWQGGVVSVPFLLGDGVYGILSIKYSFVENFSTQKNPLDEKKMKILV